MTLDNISTELVMPRGTIAGRVNVSIMGEVTKAQLGRLLRTLTERFYEVPFVSCEKGCTQLKLRLWRGATQEEAYRFREAVAEIVAQEMSR